MSTPIVFTPFRSMPRTMRRLLVMFIVPGVMLTFVAGAATGIITGQILRGNAEARVRATATALGPALTAGAYNLDLDYLQSVANSIILTPDVDTVVIAVTGLPELRREDVDRGLYFLSKPYSFTLDIKPPPEAGSDQRLGTITITTKFQEAETLTRLISTLSVVFIAFISAALIILSLMALRILALEPISTFVALLGKTERQSLSPSPGETEVTALLRFARRQVIAIMASEERNRLLVEAAGVGFFDTDIALERTVWNDCLKKILGVPANFHTAENTLQDFMSAETRAQWDDTMRAARTAAVPLGGIIKSMPYSLEMDLRRADGGEIHVLVNGIVILDPRGETLRSAGSVTDLTAQTMRATEARILDSKEAEARKMEALGRLAGGVAHDFNNIIGAQRMFANLIVDATDAVPDLASLNSYAKRIMSSCDRAADLVRQIMMLYRATEAEHAPVAAESLFSELSALLEASVKRRVNLVFQPPDPDLVLMGNEGQLVQTFMNLGINAADAISEDEGYVEFRASKKILSAAECLTKSEAVARVSNARDIDIYRVTQGALQPDVPYTCISVRDNGSGMAEAVIKRVFEPFYTTKDRGRGNGLGMAIVNSIVAAHGGAIFITTGVGVGTRISIYMPSAIERVQAALAQG